MTVRVFIFAFIIKVSIASPQSCVRLSRRREEDGSSVIAELCNDGSWHNGELRLAGSLEGTNIAVVTHNFQNQNQTRLYYQAEDLSLSEHCHNSSGWSAGQFVDQCHLLQLAVAETRQRRVVPRQSTGWNPHQRSCLWRCATSSLLA